MFINKHLAEKLFLCGTAHTSVKLKDFALGGALHCKFLLWKWCSCHQQMENCTHPMLSLLALKDLKHFQSVSHN